jgi:hypothetical protein
VDRSRLTVALTVALTLTAGALLADAGDRKPGPAGRVYKVTVVSSFATEFIDCYRFDTPNTGDLTIDELFQTIPYRRGQLDTVRSEFKAVAPAEQGFGIMFFGQAVDALLRLNGEAVNEFGDTFVYSGQEADECQSVPPEEPFEARAERPAAYRSPR